MKDDKNLYDVVIVGGGPAGLTAALYLARARYRVAVVEKERFGGQIAITEEIVNYPGIERTSGKALTDAMRRQAEGFGAELMLAEATGIESEGDFKLVRTTRGDLRCFAVLLALGSKPRTLGFPGEERYRGRGVAYCATCDGEFFTGKEVFVVGGGFAAAEESVFLTKYASRVHILIRGADFSCAASATEGARNNDKIEIHTHTVVEELSGDALPRLIRMRNTETGEVSEHQAPEGDTFGVFVLAGYVPETGLVKELVELDERGNIVTDARTQTSAPGIFAAGDVCVKSLRQVVTATGEAAIAATEIERYVAELEAKTGVVPLRPSACNEASDQGAGRRPSPGEASSASGPASASSVSAASSSQAGAPAPGGGQIFTPDMVAQLNAVFARMARPLRLSLALDERPISAELKAYCDELAGLTDKLEVRLMTEEERLAEGVEHAPVVRICDVEGAWTGLAFHGVPGGHEFTSFVLGLYNAAGPGQPIDDGVRAAIEAIDQDVRIQLLVSLTCTMCPDTVVAAQRIASLNPHVTVDVYDAGHYPDLTEKYQVMSVPCMVVDEGRELSFGRKTIDEVLALIGA